MLLCSLYSCTHSDTLFEHIPSAESGITFNNKITENDSINPLDVVNVYNGGGVGIGDFNGDGLQDIFFTGNMVPCKLYLNKGHFKFEDITAKAGVAGLGRWARGVSVVDINNDGLPDIYICNTIYKDSLQRRNILYINQGVDKDGIPHFKDESAEYGLDIHVQSTMASFFDYDNDGDLDMYLTVNEASNGNNPNDFSHRNSISTAPSIGRLYRNDWDSVHGHPVFHDVSRQAGMIYEGFGHSATICDLNDDGWKDIYVSDDFLSNNILYINNHDGTFTNRAKDYFKHTSFNSMGQDVIDINNDGLPDVVELDMNPEDNYRKKMMLGANNTFHYQDFDRYGYQYQYVRNTLQLNLGPRTGGQDSIGMPAFSEIGLLSGIAQTDWSWTPLVADFDNDGYRDLIVTNGFPRDVSDHDFIVYRQHSNGMLGKMALIDLIPQVKLHNYGFRNQGDLRFQDESTAWGLSRPGFSNGAAVADLDNDGAPDLVINNIDDEAAVYRNTSRERNDAGNPTTHFLDIKFKGGPRNIDGIGAIARIYYDHGKQQRYDNNPYRGYLSTLPCSAHFGLGQTTTVDSILIQWNGGEQQTLRNIAADHTLTVDIRDAGLRAPDPPPAIATNTLFKEITNAAGIHYTHKDLTQNDFNLQALLPHKLSEYCPALAAGDLDGNGLDDLVVGGNQIDHTTLLLQQPDGRFLQKELAPGDQPTPYYKDEGILVFDANGDGHPDIYLARGGYGSDADTSGYQDLLYLNDGHGGFTADSLALPVNHTSKLCVRGFDFNGDGKMDLFVSGRVQPARYPQPVSSFFFRNDSHNGRVKFTDVTDEIAPGLRNIGMVSDALFTDFDGDGHTDLIVVGEWMPVTFFRNVNGKFIDVTGTTGVGDSTGWWNSIAAGDFRHTGRTDYIVGNLGLNTFYQASSKYPVRITAKDFDNNGIFIAIPSLYLPDQQGNKKEFPAMGRDDISRQMPLLKKKFPTYRSFAQATMDDLLTPVQRAGAIRLQATTMSSCFLRNDGGGKFTLLPLPVEAQFSLINGMVVDDFDGDGNPDVLLSGNDYGTEVGTGHYDALNGLLLKGDGKGNFTPLPILRSGIYIPGNAKALVKLRGPASSYLLAASQNLGPLKLYELKQSPTQVSLNTDDVYALLHFKDGRVEKTEGYYGESFLSQSARFLSIGKNIAYIEVFNTRGIARKITP